LSQFPDYRIAFWQEWWGLDQFIFKKYNNTYPKYPKNRHQWTEDVRAFIEKIIPKIDINLKAKKEILEQQQNQKYRHDFIIVYKGDDLIHIEHENVIKSVDHEIKQLTGSQAPYKILITYSNKKKFKDKYFNQMKKKLDNSFQNKSHQKWLIIIGYGEKRDFFPDDMERDWFGFISENGELVELTQH
jgi:hypothetical protein